MKTYTIKPLKFSKLRGQPVWAASCKKHYRFGVIILSNGYYKTKTLSFTTNCGSLKEAKKSIADEYEFQATRYLNEVTE